ncbi:ATP-binding protein [Pseudonocardia sp. TRM90224]|uniref:ATP-binding protein n=1 Tax=Pseudonocardia sp. TRM90224 TaxID=2812678 RepID=UPI001E5757B0|nr:BTAD domain-containing putative transcriptional regulator [Pseudonocardia sp. TRM90224]
MLVCRVLGATAIEVDGSARDLGGPVPRRLVTALLVDPRHPVPDDRLADAAWAGRPPARAGVAVQAYMSRLRSALGVEHRHVVCRAPGGYLLDVRDSDVDASSFAAMVEDGRRAMSAGSAVEASKLFGEAIGQWHGRPFADLGDAELVAAPRSRLVELHDVAGEELAAARLACGDATTAVAELEELVRSAPLRERRWVLLATALYRSGRQGDALAVLRRVRGLLAEELGADPGHELQQVERQILAHDAALHAAPVRPAAGPRPVRRPLTSFVGREAQVAAIGTELASAPLVTLVGPAGVGKTRTLVEFLSSRSALGAVWFARLADVADARDLPSVVATAVGMGATTGDRTEAMLAALSSATGVLVLDNCEHVVAATARLVLDVMARCPGVLVLTTSRTPLGVEGEVVVPIEPLAVTEPDGTAGPAVTLVVDRIRSRRPGWTPGDGDREAVLRICAALDGLPLAIELAAARTGVLGLEEIADRLADRFAVLGRTLQGTVSPHSTLEASIAWSVDLLAPRDREMLVRLWPFEGGFTLDAAEAVAQGEQSGVDALESMSALVTQSVVAADTTVVPTRYRLLESIRAFCRSIDPDRHRSRAAHARWVRTLAAEALWAIRRQDAGWHLTRLTRELPNLRAGITHDLEHEPAQAVRTVANLWLFWGRCVPNAEAGEIVRAALGVARDACDRARLGAVLSVLELSAGDVAAATDRHAEALRELALIGDDADTAAYSEGMTHVAIGALLLGRVDTALELAERAAVVAAAHGHDWVVGLASVWHKAALLVQAHIAGDEDAVATAIAGPWPEVTGCMAATRMATIAVARLRHPALCADPADEMALLREAAVHYEREADLPSALGALHLGALALARLGQGRDALRLLSATREHARRRGVRPVILLDAGSTWVADAVAELVDPHERLRSDDTVELSWSEMLDLLAETRGAELGIAAS